MVQIHPDPLGTRPAYCYSRPQLEAWFAQPTEQAVVSGQNYYRLPNGLWIDQESKQLLAVNGPPVFDVQQVGQTTMGKYAESATLWKLVPRYE